MPRMGKNKLCKMKIGVDVQDLLRDPGTSGKMFSLTNLSLQLDF